MSETHPIELMIADLHHEDWLVQRNAMETLGKVGAPAVAPLITALRDADGQVRGCAAQVLGEIGDVRAVEPLIAALHDVDVWVRRRAAEALGKIGDVSAVEPLIAFLHDGDYEIRANVAHTLGEIRDVRAVEPLIVVLQDEYAMVRWSAADALGLIKNTRAVEPLIAALRDANGRVRGCAAQVLGEIGDVRAVEPLIAALHDEYGTVRLNAAEALGKIDYSEITETLEELLQEEANINNMNYKKYTILIIDDDNELIKLEQLVLKRSGFNTIFAMDGEEGMLCALTFDPDLILMDGGLMPKMDGQEATKRIIQLMPDAKIIMYSARPSGKEEAFAAGAKDFLSQPFRPNELVATVQRVIGSASVKRMSGALAYVYALEKIGTEDALAAVEAWRREQNKE